MLMASVLRLMPPEAATRLSSFSMMAGCRVAWPLLKATLAARQRDVMY